MNESIQYYHNQDSGQTYAVDIHFDREDLLETVNYFDKPIEFLVGKSYVHPNDTYCKKIGREISSSKMKPVMLYLNGTHKGWDKSFSKLEDDKLYLTFKDPVAQEVYLFRVNNKSQRPHFLGVRAD